MILSRPKGNTWLAVPLVLAFASGDAAMASPAQSAQTVYVDGLDTPVALPVVFPPIHEDRTEQGLRARAETGSVAAMKAYADFLPSPSDFPWYLKAAEAGDFGAMLTVADRAKGGQTGYGLDLPLSDKWNAKAQQIEKDAISRRDVKVLRMMLGVSDAATRAQYALIIGRAGGFGIEENFDTVIGAFPDTPEKLRLLQKCSNEGHLWCTTRLAHDYLSGNEGLVIDHALGFRLLTKVAQEGYDISGNRYGINRETGGFQNLTQTEKLQLWKMAIEHGSVEYATELGNAYLYGNGVPKSAPIAAALFQALAQRADEDGWIRGGSTSALAIMYVDGTFPVNEQAFLRALNLASSLNKDGRYFASECFLICQSGFLFDDTFNITAATKLLLIQSIEDETSPFYDAVPIHLRYASALKLGDDYSSGQHVKQSFSDAMTWYKKAEQVGAGSLDRDFEYDGVAALKIGMLYEKGLGVPKDSNTAASWYEKAVGDLIRRPKGASSLMQLLNSIQLPKESVDRVNSFIRSSADGGSIEAQYLLGKIYYEGKFLPQDYNEAAGWFRKCSDGSSHDFAVGECMETLAKMYLQGQGTTRDPARAAYYYQRMYDNGWGSWGNPSVTDILLPMYCGGEGLPMDKPKAFALFKRDADTRYAFGYPFSELGVGTMYQMGWGVEQDLAEAFNWYRKAAADKNYSSAKAKADLTRIFRDCKGTSDNFNAAVSLYEKASAGQH